MSKPKQFNLTRLQALKIIGKMTDKDDPYWDYVVEDHYDEKTDSMPTVYDVLRPLGVTQEEFDEAIDAARR